jgi:hypothetical protein
VGPLPEAVGLPTGDVGGAAALCRPHGTEDTTAHVVEQEENGRWQLQT